MTNGLYLLAMLRINGGVPLLMAWSVKLLSLGHRYFPHCLSLLSYEPATDGRLTDGTHSFLIVTIILDAAKTEPTTCNQPTSTRARNSHQKLIV
jgi:hypothetical protein